MTLLGPGKDIDILIPFFSFSLTSQSSLNHNQKGLIIILRDSKNWEKSN